MGACVGQKNVVMVLRKPIAVAIHTETVVTHAMKQDDIAPIGLRGPNKPGAQDDAVRGDNLHAAEHGTFVLGCGLGAILVFSGQWAVARM